MNQLDLSKFPKIIKPSEMEDKEEIEKRTSALQGIKDQMQNLVSSMDAYINDLINFDSKTKILNQREYEIKEQEASVAQKEQDIYKLEDEVKKEKEYIVNANRDLKEREADLLTNKDVLIQIEVEKQAYEDRKAEAIKAERILDEKTKNAQVLNKRQEQLDIQEVMIERANQIDAERKRLLDVREERIKLQEKRLHLDQSE